MMRRLGIQWRGLVRPEMLLCLLTGVLLTGCAGWEEPKLDPKHIDRVNGLINDRTQAALDVMKLLEQNPQKPVQTPRGELTSNEAVELALQHNLSLVAAAESLRIAQANLVQAGLLPNPSFGPSGAFYLPISPHTGYALAWDLLINQNINSFFTLPNKVAVAKAQRFQAGIDLASQAFSLAQQTRSQFDQLAYLTRDRRLQERIAQTYRQAVAEANAQMRVGLVTQVDVNRASIQYEDALRQARHYQAQYEGAAHQMNWLMGSSALPQWKLPDSINDPPSVLQSLPTAEALSGLALKYRLDLLRSTFDQKIAEVSVKLAQQGLVPQTTLGFDALHDTSRNWSGGPTFGTSLPIFDPGIVALSLAKYQKLQADKTHDALAGQVRQDVRTALSALQIADEDVRFFKERIIPQEEENVKEQELSFKLGNAQFDDLLNTIREYVGVLQNYEDAIQAYQQTIVGLETAVGLSFGRIEEFTRSSPHFDTTLPFVAQPGGVAGVPGMVKPASNPSTTDATIMPTTDP